MKNIKKHLQYVFLTVMTMMTFTVATPVVSTASAACPDTRFFTFPTWYKGVTNDKCEVKINALNDFWVIVMNFIEILLQLVAYVSVGFIIWGGFKYIKAEGDPGKLSEAKGAIFNAIVGLVIALASVAIVSYIQSRIL